MVGRSFLYLWHRKNTGQQDQLCLWNTDFFGSSVVVNNVACNALKDFMKALDLDLSANCAKECTTLVVCGIRLDCYMRGTSTSSPGYAFIVSTTCNCNSIYVIPRYNNRSKACSPPACSPLSYTLFVKTSVCNKTQVKSSLARVLT